jgi:hypothetical protein
MMSRFVDVSGGPETVERNDYLYLQTRGQLPPGWPELGIDEMREVVPVRNVADVDLNEREYTGIADPNTPDAGPERDDLRVLYSGPQQATYVPDSVRELDEARARQAELDEAGEVTSPLSGADVLDGEPFESGDERHTAKAERIADVRADKGRSTSASGDFRANLQADPEREEITRRERGPEALAAGRSEVPIGADMSRGSTDTASAEPKPAPRRGRGRKSEARGTDAGTEQVDGTESATEQSGEQSGAEG